MQIYKLIYNPQTGGNNNSAVVVDVVDFQVEKICSTDSGAYSNQYGHDSLILAFFYKPLRKANMAKNLQYEGLKPEAFDQFKSKLQSYGIDMSQNSGSFNEKGVSGKYNYNPETEVLELHDLSVGFPASMMLNIDTLASRLTETVVQHGGRPKQGTA